jgi:serine/threonine protein kinase
MEFLPGGDLFSVLEDKGAFDECDARIYAAQIVAGLQSLRSSGVIHRDLKPHNILIDRAGHIKLTDFGLSHFGRADGCIDDARVGTPAYMAPEVVSGRPSSFAADYWALGVVLFEFLGGCPPFCGDTEQAVFEKVMGGELEDDTLEECSDEVRDLIGKLLRQNPEERLGARSIEEIKRHPWFEGIDWDNLDQLPPPFVPDLQSEDDTGCFVERGRPDSWDNGSIAEDIDAARLKRSRPSRKSSLSREDDGIEMFGWMSIPTL